MKKAFLLLALSSVATYTFCQVANPGAAELKEKVIPWDKIMKPNGNATGKSLVVDGVPHTAYQIGLIDTFANWVKKSYIPVGGLPQQERIALPEGVNRRPYLPTGSGSSMAFWAPCYDATGKGYTRAQPASADRITILTNHFKGMTQMDWFNTPSQFFFTSPLDKKGHYFNARDNKVADPLISDIRKKIGGDYIIYFGNGTSYINVLMIPGNELPFTQLTRAELLDKAEEAVKRANNKGDFPQHMLDESMANISVLRNKYKSSLAEKAFVNIEQVTVYSFDKDSDVFDKTKNDGYTYAVYKYGADVYAASNKDNPLWLNITFYNASDRSATSRWEVYKAMTQNFNYAYVYDYFFQREHVKGKTYQPLKPISQAVSVQRAASIETKTLQAKATPDGSFFYDDFSDAVSGTMPAGWSSQQRNSTLKAERISGLEGNWVMLNNWTNLFPSSLKKTLPKDFTLSFDMATTNFTGRGGRMINFYLYGESAPGKKDVTLKLYLQPGDESTERLYPAFSGILVTSPVVPNARQEDMYFPSYTNKLRLAKIKIIKSGTEIKAFVNGQQIKSDTKYQRDYDADTRLPENVLFNYFEWKNDNSTGADGERGNVYLSNVRIVEGKK